MHRINISPKIMWLAIALLIPPSHARAQLDFGFVKELDPTNKNSAVRRGAKELDPTNKNSAVRRGAKELDPTNKNSAARKGLEKLDPSAEARRQFERARDQAMRNLRKLDPQEVLAKVQTAINQRVQNELRSRGANWNEQTGEVDLRNTSMGRSLEHWLKTFAQGNQGAGRVDAFTFNIKTRRLAVRLTVKHAHSWGRIIPTQPPVDLYSITQHASLTYDFRNHSGRMKLDLGRLAPPIDTRTFERLSEGDLIAVGETLSPRVVGDIVNYERVNQYEEVSRGLQTRYGSGNVFMSSKAFVDWASPDTIGKYAVTGVLTAGASVYPQFMRDVQRQAARELPALTAWLSRRGMGNAESVAQELIRGGQPRWPFLKFEVVPVRYSAREKPLGAFATPWRHIDHLAFVVIWDNRATPKPDTIVANTADQILDTVASETRRRVAPPLNRTTLKPRNDQPAGRGPNGETYAANLGIHYETINYDDGTFGARVTRQPEPGSPAASLGFEPGDTIFALDGQRFRRPDDVLAHRYQTSVDFINVRTKAPQSGNLYIP